MQNAPDFEHAILTAAIEQEMPRRMNLAGGDPTAAEFQVVRPGPNDQFGPRTLAWAFGIDTDVVHGLQDKSGVTQSCGRAELPLTPTEYVA